MLLSICLLQINHVCPNLHTPVQLFAFNMGVCVHVFWCVSVSSSIFFSLQLHLNWILFERLCFIESSVALCSLDVIITKEIFPSCDQEKKTKNYSNFQLIRLKIRFARLICSNAHTWKNDPSAFKNKQNRLDWIELKRWTNEGRNENALHEEQKQKRSVYRTKNKNFSNKLHQLCRQDNTIANFQAIRITYCDFYMILNEVLNHLRFQFTHSQKPPRAVKILFHQESQVSVAYVRACVCVNGSQNKHKRYSLR